MPRVYLRRVSSIAALLLFLGCVLYVNQKSNSLVKLKIPIEEHSQLDTDYTDQVEQKIDWVDHEYLTREQSRTGPGEHGTGVSLNETEKTINQKLMNVNGFSALASDKISIQRSIKDLRLEVCSSIKYSRDLPQASIIIPFHDEHWSTLLRTVHSLLGRSPKKLVRELILVDDKSTKEFLGSQLDEYMMKTFDNVKIIRNNQREGLIRSRIFGAKAASASVLIFIDSHCEAGINWLPPLLEPIFENYRTVTCPFIDVIQNDDFSLTPQDEGARGAFDWNLDYKRLARREEDNQHPERPFDSPIMAGGLFAISKDWFWELGGYDAGLEVWGGEQYELSFKIWMCGGRMVDIPCSRIGHVYRKFNPFGVPGKGDYVKKNYKRIAEVWMDDWKTYVYNKHPDSFDNIDPGDLSSQKALRVKLKCKSFDWFMKEVANDLTKLYPPSEPESLYKGTFVSAADATMCIDSTFGVQGDRVALAKCISDSNPKYHGEQVFDFTWRLDIRPKGREFCFDYPSSGRVLVLFECHNSRGNQLWKYNPETRQLVHVASQKCIDSNIQRSEIFMESCQTLVSQQWSLNGLNEQRAKKQWNQSI